MVSLKLSRRCLRPGLLRFHPEPRAPAGLGPVGSASLSQRKRQHTCRAASGLHQCPRQARRERQASRQRHARCADTQDWPVPGFAGQGWPPAPGGWGDFLRLAGDSLRSQQVLRASPQEAGRSRAALAHSGTCPCNPASRLRRARLGSSATDPPPCRRGPWGKAKASRLVGRALPKKQPRTRRSPHHEHPRNDDPR